MCVTVYKPRQDDSVRGVNYRSRLPHGGQDFIRLPSGDTLFAMSRQRSVLVLIVVPAVVSLAVTFLVLTLWDRQQEPEYVMLPTHSGTALIPERTTDEGEAAGGEAESASEGEPAGEEAAAEGAAA